MFETVFSLRFWEYISQRRYETMTLHKGIVESKEPLQHSWWGKAGVINSQLISI
jgi:hypothetical protein